MNLSINNSLSKRNFSTYNFSGSDKEANPSVSIDIVGGPKKSGVDGDAIVCDPNELTKLLSAPGEYQKYSSLKIIDNNITLFKSIPGGRCSEEDLCVAGKVKQLYNDKTITNKSLVILDSGGSHSIAAAFELAKKGFIIIMKFDNPKSEISCQRIASMMYYAKEINRLNGINIKNPNAPIAVCTDCHRTDDYMEFNIFQNTLPPVEEGNFEQIVWITEGGNGVYPIDQGNLNTIHSDLDLFGYFEKTILNGKKIVRCHIPPTVSGSALNLLDSSYQISYEDSIPEVLEIDGEKYGLSFNKNGKRYYFDWTEGKAGIFINNGRNSIDIKNNKDELNVIRRELLSSNIDQDLKNMILDYLDKMIKTL